MIIFYLQMKKTVKRLIKLDYVMIKVTKEMALDYHEEGKPGKIEIVPTNGSLSL